MCILWLLSRNLIYKTRAITLNGKKLRAFVADTPRKMTVGLMFRNRIADNGCMLFEFGRSDRHGIWMLNMRFPIDIIWLDEQKRVVDISEDVQPATALKWGVRYPSKESYYVMETSSGWVRQNKIKKGMKASFTA